MENNFFNSLENQLIETGIFDKGNEIEENYGIVLDEDMSNSPFIENPIIEKESKNLFKKRINEYDMDLLEEKKLPKEKSSNHLYEVIRRLINTKQNRFLRKKDFSLESIFFAIFPQIYKARVAKEAMKKLCELNIDTKVLLNKTIPYGEEEIRYENLIKYLNYANELRNSINRKCN